LLLATLPALPVPPPSLSALCPKARPGEFVVCAEVDPPKSRYRLPLPMERDPGDPRNTSVSAERNGLFDHDSGGIGSCFAANNAAGSGCSALKHRRWTEQRANAKDPRGRLWDRPPD
jgi:hypothetical protein